ncbi:kinesin-like protein KIF2A [Corticium candelabrum]|uniref:kinesin-like protein KIF2A n=1 Tax=Corticium candelabrum TaxID=121492 RepID=UPI002E259AF1|nr:kinesin-like protein KIF2A [Corticium candelabrum]
MSDKLTVGIRINIQRSDGRVHDAVVTAVNNATSCVTVEWFERGETKGKEIEFSCIFAINPELQTVTTAQKSRSRLRQSERPAPRIQSPLALQNNNAAAVSRLSTPVASQQRGGGRLRQLKPPQLRQVPPPAADPLPAKESKQSIAGGRRKSHCVKEVEKIKKQRDERRAKHADVVQHRRDDRDSNNPNYEFLQMIREYKQQIDVRPLQMSEPIGNHCICVCVRKRPLNRKEISKKDIDVVTIPDKENTVVHECKLKVDLTKFLENHQFRFDFSFDENATNTMVYRYTAQPLVETIFDRGMATCFAYGQTGSGKTHTMGGDFHGKDQDCSKGIYIMAAQDVFRLAKLPKNRSKDLTVSCSFFEIYSGKVFDLLNEKKKLCVLEDGNQVVQVVGLEEEIVHDVPDVLQLIQSGNTVRTSGTTSANQHSSRSHAIFQIILRKRTNGKLYGKFSLIDLAGNERGADTSSSNRQTRMEGAEINKSLLALKECIRALGRKGAHLPFRASKLTQVLRDSFIGDRARTCMIAMISPGLSSCEHTLNTLRYADRVKELETTSLSKAGAGGDDDRVGNDVVVDVTPTKVGKMEAARVMTPSESDLVLLHESLKRSQETSDELLTFHEAVSHLVQAQDELVDEHRSIIQDFKDLANEEEQLLDEVDNPDYDIEEYVDKLTRILSTKKAKIHKLEDKLVAFKKQLQEEEAASKRVKRTPYV